MPDDRYSWSPDPLSQMQTKIEGLTKLVDDLEKNKVSREEFDPVKLIAFGLVSIAMVGLLAIILNLVNPAKNDHMFSTPAPQSQHGETR
jgi:hypothetical protein